MTIDKMPSTNTMVALEGVTYRLLSRAAAGRVAQLVGHLYLRSALRAAEMAPHQVE
jgi:hypothetical protein